MEDEVRSQSMLDLARAVWARRKWIAVLAFVGPLAAVASVLAFMPRLYEAKATVLVERQQFSESLVKATVNNELELRLHGIHEEVLSRARLEELITHFNLYPEARKDGGTKGAVDRLRQDIKLEKKTERSSANQPATVGFTVSYRDQDPQKASDVTNALARFYVVSNAKQRERQANATASFLKAELEQTKGKLDQLEKKVGDYKKRNPGALPDQVQFNMLTIERLYSELRMNRDAQARLAERAETAAGPGGGGIDLPPQQDRAAARLALLRAELTELSTRYTDKYPDVVAKKQEIADLERQMASGPKRTPAPVAQAPAPRSRASDARMASLRTEEQQILDRIAGYQKRIEDAPKREQEVQELARDYETTKELYRSYKQRYEEALLGESMEAQHRGELFRIVEPATAPDVPTAPRTARLALLGLMASLGLAAAAVMLAEQVDTSYHSLDDLRAHLGVTATAAIPSIVTAADERRRRRRLQLAGAFAVVGLVLVVALSWLIASGNYELVAMLARRG